MTVFRKVKIRLAADPHGWLERTTARQLGFPREPDFSATPQQAPRLFESMAVLAGAVSQKQRQGRNQFARIGRQASLSAGIQHREPRGMSIRKGRPPGHRVTAPRFQGAPVVRAPDGSSRSHRGVVSRRAESPPPAPSLSDGTSRVCRPFGAAGCLSAIPALFPHPPRRPSGTNPKHMATGPEDKTE